MTDARRADPPMHDADQALAAALVESLARSPAALMRLRDLVSAEQMALPVAPFYTVTALANVAGVSPRVVRGAIGRGELQAVKRGRRWIISPAAVRDWAQVEPFVAPGRRRARRPRDRRLLTDSLALLERGANISRPGL